MLETQRLRIRRFGLDDAPFVLELINDPDWHRFIGDRGVRTLEGARGYIEKSLLALYARLGFGLDLVELKDGTPIGMCGLIKRDTLEDVDIGFAFMPAWRGRGFAYESSLAVRDYAIGELGLERLVAVTSPDNDTSGKLLLRLGFRYKDTIPWGADGDVSKLYSYDPQHL